MIRGGVIRIPSLVFKGRLAQLVEHLVYTERVGSSSLSSPTIYFKDGTLLTAKEFKGGCSSVG